MVQNRANAEPRTPRVLRVVARTADGVVLSQRGSSARKVPEVWPTLPLPVITITHRSRSAAQRAAR